MEEIIIIKKDEVLSNSTRKANIVFVTIGIILGIMALFVIWFAGLFLLAVALFAALLARSQAAKARNFELVVTNKRIYSRDKIKNTNLCDISFEHISHIAKTNDIIVISTSSTRGYFCCDDVEEVYQAITEQIKNVQTKHVIVEEDLTKHKTEEKESSADELREYKKLLDDGIITQEEYDAKKKQLLGL